MSELSRNGNFSSSEIWKLTKSGRGKSEYFGAPAMTYIEEKRMERRLGRPLQKDHDARPTNWGTLCESIGFDNMPLEYQLVSKKRHVHPEIKCWVGIPDIESTLVAGDIKCPWTLRSFCKLVDAMKDGESLKANNGQYDYGEKYYWQIVSNAILTGKNKGALYVYCPYQEDLVKIREAAAGWDGKESMSFVNYCTDDDLPYLIRGNEYKDLNELIFDIPQSDIDFLTERVIEAEKLLLTC